MCVGSLDPAARCGKPCVWPRYGDAGGEVRELVRCGDVCRACALTVPVAFLCPTRLQSRPPSVPSLLSRRLSVCLRRSSPPSAYRHAPSRAPPNSPPRRRFASASPPSRHSYRCPTVRSGGLGLRFKEWSRSYTPAPPTASHCAASNASQSHPQLPVCVLIREMGSEARASLSSPRSLARL